MGKELDALLSRFEGDVPDLARAARKLVLGLLPGLHEKVHAGWKVINFTIDGSMKTLVCGIALHKEHVNLQLMGGSTLEDPEGLLEGTGARVRHVKIRTSGDLRRKAVRALVKGAAAYVMKT